MAERPEEKVHKTPVWVKSSVTREEYLCSDCFKVCGVKSRYELVCKLGKKHEGATVGELTKMMHLQQPTITHHLNILKSVDAVTVQERGRERVYKINRDAHCFEECKIPY
ncbi:helix-turn-helix transcriptional regulator [Candidatus Kaiserbacteria bacterium]|nr:helix-turn-helix transcriptional regulator [Candidatus Kaiserbacteria bacterium]